MQKEVGLGVFFFTGHEGTFGVRRRYSGAASLEVPPLCCCKAMFHLFCLVGDIAGSLWAHCGDIREFVAWRLLWVQSQTDLMLEKGS